MSKFALSTTSGGLLSAAKHEKAVRARRITVKTNDRYFFIVVTSQSRDISEIMPNATALEIAAYIAHHFQYAPLSIGRLPTILPV